MFLKVVKSSQGIPYVYVVDGYRDDEGKVRHKYLFSLGRLDDFINSPSFRKLASLITGQKEVEKEITASISEGELRRYGHLVLKKLWDRFRLDEYFSQLDVKGKREFDIAKAVFYMVSRHIIESDSKLGMYESKGRYINQGDLGLNHLYRALDVVSERKEDIEGYLFEQKKSLFNMTVDVVFYDVTTIYFESHDEGILRRYGYSKDGKINRVQVVMGLIVDREGRPIGFDIFSGNTFDGKTLEVFLERMKERFKIERVIIVADRGINSKVNLLRLRELGYSYIVGMRLKGKGREFLDEVFKEEGYREVTTLEGVFKYKVIPYVNKIRDTDGNVREIEENVVVSYSTKRAKRDASERERLIEKAKEMLRSPSKIDAINKRGGKRYLTLKRGERMEWGLDEERIREDERFDGYYAIESSERWMKAEEVIAAYHDLWRIEESFRIMKSNLEVRPVFHWTERRIKGHFVVCFIAFLLLRTLEVMLREKEEKVSSERIKEALREMIVTEVSIEGKRCYLKHKLNEFQKRIMRIVKAEIPENLTVVEDFSI